MFCLQDVSDENDASKGEVYRERPEAGDRADACAQVDLCTANAANTTRTCSLVCKSRLLMRILELSSSS